MQNVVSRKIEIILLSCKCFKIYIYYSFYLIRNLETKDLLSYLLNCRIIINLKN